MTEKKSPFSIRLCVMAHRAKASVCQPMTKLKSLKSWTRWVFSILREAIREATARTLNFFSAGQILAASSQNYGFWQHAAQNSIAEHDSSLLRIVESGVPAATLVGKSWDFHVHTALQTTLEENLAMISDSFAFLKRNDVEAIYDAEHFFDGYKNNPEYAIAALRSAQDAGAD